MTNININFYNKLLPDFVRRADPQGALRAIVDAVQSESDALLGEILSITDQIDADTCPPELLPYLASHLGLVLYQEDPVDLQRYQITRWVDFLKKKGTVPGMETLARTLGYDGKVISLFEDAPDGNKFEPPYPPGTHMSSDVILVFNEIVDGQVRRLSGNENGALTPQFIQRLLGRIEEIRPIHINVFGIRIGKELTDTLNIGDDLHELGIGTHDCLNWISCSDMWHGRCASLGTGYEGPWDNPHYKWDALIYPFDPSKGLRFYWDTMNLHRVNGEFIRHDNADLAYRDGQTILDRDNIDEWDEHGASWDQSGENWDTNTSPFVHGPYNVRARHDACGMDSDPLEIVARGQFQDELFGGCVHHDGFLRDRTGRIVYDRSGRNYDQCDPAEIYIRNVNCPEQSFWDGQDESWTDQWEYFWDQSPTDEDPYYVVWDTPHGNEVYWDRPVRRAAEANDHWDAIAVPYRKWDCQGLVWDDLIWDSPWIIWDDPEENETWDGFTVSYDEFQTVYNWDNPEPYVFWDDGDLHWDLPDLDWDDGAEAWDDDHFYWDGYCGPYFTWDDPDFVWDEYVVIWDDQNAIAGSFVPN